MRTFGQLHDETMAGPVDLAYWLGEVDELLVEIRALNWSGIREEWSDVACLGTLMLIARGWTWLRAVPLMPGFGLYAAKKFEKRLGAWNRIFSHYGVRFDKKYLVNGGNFAKVRKVRAALLLAGVETLDEEWLFEQGICTE
jgi:hypothetical protein